MPFISYAQNYEDVILWRALRDVARGFYVDVGAADPLEESVTNAFYERGWSGINIEPLDEYFRKLTKARPRDININAAVADEAGLRIMYAFAATGLSTLDPEIASRHQAAGRQPSETVVPVVTLKAVLENCAPSTIHFLKIDVEGAEGEVLKGLDLTSVRPWVIVVEATAPNSQVITRENWEHLIVDHDYNLVYFDGLNCFYLAGERASLKERFSVPPNFFDQFVPWREWFSQQKAANLEQKAANLEQKAANLEQKAANLENELIELRANKLRSNIFHLSGKIARTEAAIDKLCSQVHQLQHQSVHTESAIDQLRSNIFHLSEKIHQLQVQSAAPSIDRAMGRFARHIQEVGDRVTGGGARALAKRALKTSLGPAIHHGGLKAVARTMLKAFPNLRMALYQLAMKQDVVTTSSVPSPAIPPPPDSAANLSALPTSARPTYLSLKAAMSQSDARSRMQ